MCVRAHARESMYSHERQPQCFSHKLSQESELSHTSHMTTHTEQWREAVSGSRRLDLRAGGVHTSSNLLMQKIEISDKIHCIPIRLACIVSCLTNITLAAIRQIFHITLLHSIKTIFFSLLSGGRATSKVFTETLKW